MLTFLFSDLLAIYIHTNISATSSANIITLFKPSSPCEVFVVLLQ